MLSPLAAGGCHDGHRSLLALDVLRHRRSGSPDLLLRRARDLRHADRAPRRRRSGHLVGALRHLRRGAHARRAHRPVRARYGTTIVEGYGLSECTCAATINPIDGPRKAGTVGLPLPGHEVALLDSDGRPTTEGPGEVIVRGPNVMRGYLNQPEDTAATLEDGWLHTGDVGYFDADGYLVLVDRVKDMIIRGGENIYPKEIENVLYSHPAVLEAAVVGRPHAVLGEEPVAFVALEPRPPTVDEELVELCPTSLGRYKVPRDVVVLDALPKNAVGKIAKPELRILLRSTAPRGVRGSACQSTGQ